MLEPPAFNRQVAGSSHVRPTMFDFIKKLTGFSPTNLLPDLDAYAIPNRPRRTVVVEKKKTADGQVFDGQEWKTEWDANGNFEANKVTTDVPVTPERVVLDEYDLAYLDDVVGRDWRKDQSRAKVMKWHWLREESAQRIQEYHTADGKLQRGFSERSAATFVKAFYAADDARQRDQKQRQRTTQTGTPLNVFDWD